MCWLELAIDISIEIGWSRRDILSLSLEPFLPILIKQLILFDVMVNIIFSTFCSFVYLQIIERGEKWMFSIMSNLSSSTNYLHVSDCRPY